VVGPLDALAVLFNLFGIVKHHAGALFVVLLAQRVLVAAVGGQLVEQDGVRLAILNVSAKVLDALVLTPSVLEVVVDPAEQNLLRRQAQQIVNVFAGLQEPVQLRMRRQRHVGQQTDADNLPDETEDNVGRGLDNVVGSNVDHGAANRSGRVDGQIVVLGRRPHVELLAALGPVDGALVNGAGHGRVDELAQQHAVVALFEQLVAGHIDGHEAGQVLVVGEHKVNVRHKGRLFLLAEMMHSALLLMPDQLGRAP